MKKIYIALAASVFLLAGCGQKDDTPAIKKPAAAPQAKNEPLHEWYRANGGRFTRNQKSD